jgi:hypothetical protein
VSAPITATELPVPPSTDLTREYLIAMHSAIGAVMDQHGIPDKDRASHLAQTVLEAFRITIGMSLDGAPPATKMMNEASMRAALQSLSETIDVFVGVGTKETVH